MRLTKTSDSFGGMVWFRSQDRNDLWLEPCEMTAHDSRRAIDELAAYEDAEEQGLLVRLPCKVGDTLYAPTRNFVSEFRVSQLDFGGYEEPYLWVNWYLTKGITGNFRIDGIKASEIGKTVFLTRAEAEAALKGEREDV